MPSGAKKRKAAKKKKKLGENNNAQSSNSATATNSHSHGEEASRHDDNKETDGAEVSYLASQDHQFNDRGAPAKKQLEISPSELSIDGNKSSWGKNGSKEANVVAIEGGSTVQVERELKLEGESMSHNINIEHMGPTRFPREGGLRRRSSSSSSKPAMSDDIVQVATSASETDIMALHSIGSSEKEKVALKDDEKLELSYDAPKVDASVRADDMNGSLHDHQPAVALGPQTVQTTSWKSCCGLFEVFAGSNK